MAPLPPLPTSHPLLLELEALRSQLHTTQTAAHRSGLALQSARLELSLASGKRAALERSHALLLAEVNALRGAPLPPPKDRDGDGDAAGSSSAASGGVAPESGAPGAPGALGGNGSPTIMANGHGGAASRSGGSNAVAELTLAHRRLSAKLDLTESRLEGVQLELAGAQHEIVRLGREREGDRAVINELRRREGEWEEELGWEKGERRKAEEQKKLCDLALQEYATLVKELDPSAVPPALPSTSAAILASPTLGEGDENATSDPAVPSSRPDDISNLLLGQRGVHALVRDFTSHLATKDADLSSLRARVDELELCLSSVTKQLEDETSLRVSCMAERDRALRDDASAARVVERYMTFTQKAHATLHMHLDNLRARASATQASLRNEVLELTERARAADARAERMEHATGELSEGVSRETAGRRREVGLRLRMIAEEEARGRRVERWLDRVRRAREGAEGAVLDAQELEGLVDEALEAIAGRPGARVKGEMGKRDEGEAEAESLTRVLLAEELVNTLVRDLQEETERRMELEKQRIEWISASASRNVVPKLETAEVMFDLDADMAPFKASSPLPSPTPLAPEAIPTPSPLPSPALTLGELDDVFRPLRGRYTPLQTRLHATAHALAALRAAHTSTPTQTPTQTNPTLDHLHETLEDARVDAEIALADEERVYRGFEALLQVGKEGAGGEEGGGGQGQGHGPVVRSASVLSDAREYVAQRTQGEAFARLEKRVGELEEDTVRIKEAVMRGEAWEGLVLKSVQVVGVGVGPFQVPDEAGASSPLRANGGPGPGPGLGGGRRGPMGMVGSVGRSFSASIVGAPRRVTGLAGALYRPGVRRDKDKDKDKGMGMGMAVADGAKQGQDKRLVDDVE